MNSSLLSPLIPSLLVAQHGGQVRVTPPFERDECFAFQHNTCVPFPALQHTLDQHYGSHGYIPAPLACAHSDTFTLRTYRHLAGSQIQLMIAHRAQTHTYFIEEQENQQQRTLREALA